MEKVENRIKYVPKFVSPDNSTVNIFDPRIWRVDDFLQYLGENVERGLPVTIWESELEDIVVDKDGKSRRAVVTRFYATNATRSLVNVEDGTPLKVVIKVRR